MNRRLEIKALLEEVRHACDFVVEAAQDVGLDARAVYHCEMAVDETCTNVVEHGYKGAAQVGMITIAAQREDNCLKITISDSGPPFDPTSQAEPDIQSEAVKLKPGGWGIYFIKQLMDEVRYEYGNGQNHLVMLKCLPEEVESVMLEDELSVEIMEGRSGYWILQLAGRLDTASSPSLATKLAEQLNRNRHHLILDLQQVDYVSSSGLKVLASAWRDIRDVDGRLLLVGLNQRLLEIFDMVGFTTFFDIYEDVSSALATKKP